MTIILKQGRSASDLERLFNAIATALNLRSSLRYKKSCYAKVLKNPPSSGLGHYNHGYVKEMCEALGKPELIPANLSVEEIHALASIRIVQTIKTVAEATKNLKHLFGLDFTDGDIEDSYAEADHARES